MKISVFGLGYVGAVNCGCLPPLGHEVIGVDIATAKVDAINRGASPIIEAEMDGLVANAVGSGRLRATTDATAAVAATEVAIVCVGTPSDDVGRVNLTYVERVMEQIGEAVAAADHQQYVVMLRSTSPPPAQARMAEILAQASGRRIGKGLGYVCHPEFLREGQAVGDFRNPPKIVFGASDADSRAICDQLYPGVDAETFHVAPEVAAMVKYADNCFHAVKVTFGNEIGVLCRAFGVDSHAVMEIFCRDEKLNISPRYLRPGFAFGGSCLPKDLRNVLATARERALPTPMLAGTMESNRLQIELLLDRIVGPDRPTIAIVGLAFKEGTDDVRESPMVTVVEHLTGKRHPVLIYDEALSVPSLVGANRAFALRSIEHLEDLLCHDLPSVIDQADIVVVSHRLTEAQWSSVQWKPDQRVIDLQNIPALRAAPGYEGLYW